MQNEETNAVTENKETGKEVRKLELRIPDWNVPNGSHRLVMQMERSTEMKQTESGIWLPKMSFEEIAERYRSPIPNDAVFYVVAYDPDINLKYRKEKLKLLNLDEQKHKVLIAQYENKGMLDCLRLGDEIVWNKEHFIPVKIMDEFTVYYVCNLMDVIGIRKQEDRMLLERQKPESK